MCLGIPLRLIARSGIAGQAEDGDKIAQIDLSLVPDAKPGDWVLTFLGSAREILTEDEALKIRAALQGLSDLMAGRDLGTAFADLDARSPTLPPHLQAAHDAGLATG